jgi:methanogenic corrinoid protein MtbC1
MDDRDARATGALAEWYRGQLSTALDAGSRPAAERVVREALDAGLSAQTIYDDVIGVAMHQIGARWEAGEIGVADEHLATSISFGLVPLVGELSRVAAQRREERIVLAAVEGEQHVLGLRMAADLLEAAGFQVFFLGADVPTEALIELLRRREVSVCALTATMPHVIERLAETVRRIHDETPVLHVLAGGQAATSAPLADPTTATVPDITAVVEAADGLLQGAPLN